MAIAPRNPEIKHNLGVDNGSFGTLLSLAGIGSAISLMFGGHIVHRVGPRPVLTISSTLVYAAIAVMPHLHTAWIFAIVNIIMGACLSAYHISINGQALRRQEETGLVLIPKLHGLWTVGALTTAILAFAVTSQVSLAWHIDVMMLLIWLRTQVSIWKMREDFFSGTTSHDGDTAMSLRTLFAAFSFEPKVTFGLVCVLMIEFASTDWATIFTKEQIGMNASLSILSYILFMLSMIFGRFTIHKLLQIKSERYLIVRGPLIGGAGFIGLLILGNFIAPTHRTLGFLLVLLAFIFGGLGCSHLAPTFFGIAGRRSSLPGSVVVASLGLVNGILIFFIKIGISWIAQATSVLFALLIPGILLMATSLVAHLGRDEVLAK